MEANISSIGKDGFIDIDISEREIENLRKGGNPYAEIFIQGSKFFINVKLKVKEEE